MARPAPPRGVSRFPLAARQHQITDNLDQLIDVLPPAVRQQVYQSYDRSDAVERVRKFVGLDEAS